MSYSDRRGLADKMAYLVVILQSSEILHTFSNSISNLIISGKIPATNSYLDDVVEDVRSDLLLS